MNIIGIKVTRGKVRRIVGTIYQNAPEHGGVRIHWTVARTGRTTQDSFHPYWQVIGEMKLARGALV